MSRLLILILLMLSIPLAAADLEPIPDASKPHGSKLERLSKKLGLTEDQKFKIKKLLHANKEKIQTLKETDPEQLKATLSSEQKDKLEQLRKNPQALRKLENEVKGKKLKIN
jgi:Spy/CpxP family protein refolding chaperone